MELSPSKSPKAHSEILEQICDAILRGELRKGDWLPSERQIAAQTGISRTSVREALRILTAAGLLEATVGWGGGRRLVSIAMSASLLGSRIDEDPKLLSEFYEARNIIETSAAQLPRCARRRNKLPNLNKSSRRWISWSPKIRATMRVISPLIPIFTDWSCKARATRSSLSLYLPIMRKLWLLKDAVNIEEFHSYGLPSMRRLVEAVKARDPQAAGEAMQAHVRPLIDLLRHAREDQPAAQAEQA